MVYAQASLVYVFHHLAFQTWCLPSLYHLSSFSVSVSGWTKCKIGPTAAAILKIGSVWPELTSYHLNLLQKMVSSTLSRVPHFELWRKSSATQKPPCDKGGALSHRWKMCGWCETHCSNWKLSYYVCSFSWNPETHMAISKQDYTALHTLLLDWFTEATGLQYVVEINTFFCMEN